MRKGIIVVTACTLAASPGVASLLASEDCVHLQSGCPVDYDAPGHERPSIPVQRIIAVIASTGSVS